MPPTTLLRHRSRALAPGLLLVALGVGSGLALHRLAPAVGVLTWAVLLGAGAGQLRAVRGFVDGPGAAGLRVAGTRMLRTGVALLGLTLPLTAVLALGPLVLALVAATLVATLAGTWWAGRRLGLGRPRTLLLAAGTAICGASAVAAVQTAARADEDDVAAAVAQVTVFGSLLMLVLPVLQRPLGLTDHQLGVWAGASVHEVGQVVAAAGPAGQAAVAAAVVVKLTRVLMLAPVVACIGLVDGRATGGSGGSTRGARAPGRTLVPLFVVGFLLCAGLRTSGLVPGDALDVLGWVQGAALAAGLFALGTRVHLGSLLRSGRREAVLGGLATLAVVGSSLAWVTASA